MGKILTRHGEKAELMKIFNCSLPTVRGALNGSTKSELAVRIRKAAIERGGVEKNELKSKKGNQ